MSGAVISDRADQTRSEGFAASQGLEHYSPEWRKKYIRQGYFSYPRALRPVFENEYAGQDSDYEDIVPFASYDIDKNSLADCTGLCIFWTGFWQYNPIMVDDHVNLIRHAAGVSMDEEKAMDVAKRTAIMTRAYNVMTGIDRRDDTIHPRFFEKTPDGDEPVIDRGRFDEMISRFYWLRGWDDNGIPSAAELDRLGLEDVRRKMESKGLL